MVDELLVEDQQVRGKGRNRASFCAPCVILTTGTYLRGRIIMREISYSSGPNGLQPALALTDSLQKLGIRMGRFKTGTPPRVSVRLSILAPCKNSRG